ncbi:SMI1/KNR4 family protein [Clostridium bornimense]|uniref:SMI1/KNR4 family protein n=1 Tax=Clostridium bornimense TaxID=1216932 RepID=UPI001C11F76C|nr:SMI1/KNR4 family protein [Clostridium bornimense]MBU5316813.1 SMI1/KNR4 family protein [Clostridium bornimense]
MSIIEMIDVIKRNLNCKVYPVNGLPVLPSGFKLPSDLETFYRLCGGVSLFCNSKYSFDIVGPKDMVLANPVIVGELCEEDISSKWFIIGKDFDNNYITIDLSTERLGRCYDSFWDRHGVVGECDIIAKSFTELVEQLLINQGKSIYWLDENFNTIGDAYDNV